MNAVVAGVIQDKRKILVAQRDDGLLAGKWEFPGGKVEGAESPGEALVREIFEEFGVVIEVGPRIVGVPFCLMGKAYTLIAFFAQHVSGEYQLNRHRQIKWVDVDELTRMNLAPADIPVALAINRLRRTEGR